MAPLHSPDAPLIVVGIGADGWPGLTGAQQELIKTAKALVGGPRHLELIPENPDQSRLPWPKPLRAGLRELIEDITVGPIVILASGDPLVSGVGSTLIEEFGASRVRIHPAISSVSLARARLGWTADSCEVISLVGRPVATMLRALAPSHRLLLLSSDQHTPNTVAELLRDHGYGDSVMHVLGDLGTATETHTRDQARDWKQESPRLNVIGVELAGPVVGPRSGGLDDERFEHDGQLTKRDLRAGAIARLAPQPGELLWDVGAGAGSLAIEWMRAHPSCKAIAIEVAPERADRIQRNAERLGVPGLQVIRGSAPDALDGLPTPNAIFIGGGATAPGVVESCMDALAPGGRLVIHGVTLETEALLVELHRAHGGELNRIQIETAVPLGRFTGWKPARAVTSWSFRKGV